MSFDDNLIKKGRRLSTQMKKYPMKSMISMSTQIHLQEWDLTCKKLEHL